MKDDNDARVRRALLAWYDRTRRDLPWRRTRDPYAIWIAEAMLQQTQVKTVLRYYVRFLEAFPSIAALDAARPEKVLALWSGLGYYRRALNLKRAARSIARDHAGKMPRDFTALRSLPGIGSYTAGALMSIAFNRPYPALDGNARRVLTRLFRTGGEASVQRLAARLAATARPGDWNQALMDLGATVCLPRDPECARCPLAFCCRARERGRIARRNRFASKSPVRKVEWPLALIATGRKILLRRRPRGGILPGLWEIPGGERKKSEPLRAALLRELDGLGRRVTVKSIAGVLRHSITNRRIRAPVYFCSWAPCSRPGPGWRWLPLDSLDRYPLSSLSLKAVKLIAQP